MTKWAAAFACTLVLALACMALAPQASFAASAVSYIDASGKTQTCTTYTSITADTTSLSDGWYVVDADVTVSSRMTVSGDVNLILMDGKTLTASSGITVESGNSLTVYGQSQGTGALQATQADSDNAGIGGSAYISGGSFTVNGGTVAVTGGIYGAGIGGGYKGAGGTVTVNGGTVTVTGGRYGAGIGGGSYRAGGTVTVNGGTVTAQGGQAAAGIGGGFESTGGTLTVNGGTVTATGGYDGAGIGGGYKGAGGTVTVSGGTVTATGGYYSAGIGGGHNGAGGTLTVSGGTVTATGGYDGAGIGGGNGGAGGTVTVNGGTVTANGGQHGAGIGGGWSGAGGTVLMTGGVIAATAGSGGSDAIGGGLDKEDSTGSLTVSPAANTDIYAEAGSAVDSTTAVTGSPFTASADIISSVANNKYVKLYSAPHTHSWTYSASGATLTATCSSVSSHTASLTVSAPTDLEYDGSAKTASLSDASTWTGYGLTVPTISYSGDTTNVSSAGATASITAGSATASVAFTITKADATVTTAPAATNPTYTGSAQELVTTGATSDGTLYYRLKTGDSTYTDWATTVPTATNAGSYEIEWYIKGDANHNDTTAQTISASISPSGTAPNAPSEISAPYTNTTLADVTLPSGWEWTDSTTALEVGVPVTATAKYTAADAGNYATTEVSVTVTRSACTHPANMQEVRNAKAATATEAGYTGDTYCTQCGEMTAKGSTIPATGSDTDDSADSSNGSSSTTVLAETGDAATPFAATAFACALAALAAAGFAARKDQVK